MAPFTRSFQIDENAPSILIDVSAAPFWDISGVGALNKIIARLRREVRDVDVIGYNRVSADIVDKFALYDKTGVELGAVPPSRGIVDGRWPMADCPPMASNRGKQTCHTR